MTETEESVVEEINRERRKRREREYGLGLVGGRGRAAGGGLAGVSVGHVYACRRADQALVSLTSMHTSSNTLYSHPNQ